MPYDGEFAGYKPLGRILENPRVRELLGSFVVREPSKSRDGLEPVRVSDIKPSQFEPKWILAVDGSKAETPLRNGFPGAEAAYITVACVLVDIETIQELDQHRPADPKAFRRTHQPDAIDCALPGANVVMAGEPTAQASLRKALFAIFEKERMTDTGESILDTYHALLAYKPIDVNPSKAQKCPYDDCDSNAGSRRTYRRGEGQYQCECPLARSLYSTDALRIHERMVPAGTNGLIFGEVLQVLERIWIIHVLRTLEKNDWLSSLRRIAIVLDGPLAVFGQPAWLSQAIGKELHRLNPLIKRATGGMDLLMLGIEKSGNFVDHFDLIDQDDSGSPDQYPKQSALLISDEYIKKNIIYSESTKQYGADTYFGRKLFYKTKSGARLVVSIPFLNPGDSDTARADADQYPRLADAMGLMDQIVSSRFPNAASPLIAAHAESSIPLHLGSRVLEKLARELIKDETT